MRNVWQKDCESIGKVWDKTSPEFQNVGFLGNLFLSTILIFRLASLVKIFESLAPKKNEWGATDFYVFLCFSFLLYALFGATSMILTIFVVYRLIDLLTYFYSYLAVKISFLASLCLFDRHLLD